MTPPVYRFNQYSVDPATRELRRGGELVVVSPIVFDCLAWLLAHRDRAVGRDELSSAVWGRTDIADTQVVQAILKARRALGDTGDEQRVIRTIPRFGYRWVAAVDLDEAPTGGAAVMDPAAESPASAAPPNPTTVPVRSAHGGRGVTVAVVVLVAIAAILGLTQWKLNGTAPPVAPSNLSSTPTATAVLPVTVEADAEWGWLRLGLMDLISGRLREAGLTVVPSDNVVSIVRDAMDSAAAERIVRDAVNPRWTIFSAVRRTAAGWTVTLEVHGGVDTKRVVEASALEPALAAREATDRLLPVLGLAVAKVGEPVDDFATKARSALLANDFHGAQRHLDSATPAQRVLPEVRQLQAQLDFDLGHFEAADLHFSELLDELGTSVEQTDPLPRVRALNGRGATAIRLVRAAAAEDDFDQSLDILRERNEPALAGQAYSGRGVARALQGEDDGAMADFARARIALQLAGDTLALARVEINEGALNGQRGHPAEALARFRSAASHFERFDARTELANALSNQMEAHLALLEPEQAFAVATRAQQLVPKLEDKSASRLITYWRAASMAAVGRLAEAREILDALMRSPEIRNDGAVLALSRNREAALAFDAGEIESAAALARLTLTSTATEPWKEVRIEAWLTLIRALAAQRKDAEAAIEVERFASWAREEADHSSALFARVAQAEQAWSEHNREDAQNMFTEALALAERHSVPAEVARVGVSFGNSLIAEGKLEAAASVVGRVARWASTDFACALLQARMYRQLGQTAAWQAALGQARAIAGERAIPASLLIAPGDASPVPTR